MALLLSYMYKLSCLFALDGCYTRENLTLDSLEQSTTTSRDVANLIGQTELVDTSYRVATTDQRECTLGSCLGDSLTDTHRQDRSTEWSSRL